MKVRFVSAARSELFTIARRYDRKQEFLGDQLLDEAQRTLAFIKEYPLARTPICGTTRRWRLKRFPYGLLYAVEGDIIYILAVGHLRRQPRFWTTRSHRKRE